MIHFEGSDCSNLDSARKREWIETNGVGGYASSTIVGFNTRRYHGLLIASLNPPAERYLLVSNLEESLNVNGQVFELSVNQYPGAVHPQGFKYLKEFRLDPFPVFIYDFTVLEIFWSSYVKMKPVRLKLLIKLHIDIR